MDITVYKRGKDGKKIHKETNTRSVKIKFKDKDIDIKKNIYIGRNETNAIAIKDDHLVSRRHALIEQIKGKFLISDLGSTNGTYVNNNPIPNDQKIELQSGDIIRVGKTELTVG